jgi:hypothetical protein
MVYIFGCHLVGSIPGKDARTCFKLCSDLLGPHLKRFPDGETNDRQQSICSQASLFPEIVQTGFNPAAPMNLTSKKFSMEEIEEGIRQLKLCAGQIKTKYNVEALQSFNDFQELKAQGDISSHVKFQVSLPTISSALSFLVAPPFQESAESIYGAALFESLETIQGIPPQELVIQLDIALDILYFEDVWPVKPWWAGKGRAYLVDYIAEMVNKIDSSVENGLHFCYGKF